MSRARRVVVASACVLALAPDVGAADPVVGVGPVSVSVPGDPVLEVDDPSVSIDVAGEAVVVVDPGSISVGGSDPAPAAGSPPATTPAPASAPTPIAEAGADGFAATGARGVSKPDTFSPVSSVITTSSGKSVSAQGASGVRSAKVRYITRNVHRTGRVTMIVTVKDRAGLLVRGAKVRIGGVAKTNFLTLKGTQTKTTSKTGQVTFSFKLNKKARSKKSVGKRFVVASIASTPTASTSLVTSFRVPAKRSGR